MTEFTRDHLAALARKSRTKTALRTALVAHFNTDAGKAALANAPLHYGAGLPQPMTAEVAANALLEEAEAFLPKPKKVKR